MLNQNDEPNKQLNAVLDFLRRVFYRYHELNQLEQLRVDMALSEKTDKGDRILITYLLDPVTQDCYGKSQAHNPIQKSNGELWLHS